MVARPNVGNAPATCVLNCFRRKTVATAIAMMQQPLPRITSRSPQSNNVAASRIIKYRNAKKAKPQGPRLLFCLRVTLNVSGGALDQSKAFFGQAVGNKTG